MTQSTRHVRQVCFLTPEELEELDRRAAEAERSKSYLLRKAWQEWVLNTSAPKPLHSEVQP